MNIHKFSMKHNFIILLFELCSTVCVFSQGTLQEFVIEKDGNDNPPVIYKSKGCTPDVGVIVFYTSIPDLNFSLPDTPSRLKNVSAFDKINNCYVLCMQPTDTKIGGIMQYSVAVTGTGYKPIPAFMISGIKAGIAQYFNIKLKEYRKNSFENLKNEIARLEEENGITVEMVDQVPVDPVYKKEIIRPKEEETGDVADSVDRKPAAPGYSAISWYREGKSNNNTGNFSEAIRCYRNALEIDPSLLDAWNGLAVAYFHLGKYFEAIECYKKVAENNPSVTVWNYMGICYQHLQEYDNAIDCFRESNGIANNGSAWYGMGLCYAKKKNHTKTMKCLKKAAQLGHKETQELLTGINKKW